jgi:hypothetical protein
MRYPELVHTTNRRSPWVWLRCPPPAEIQTILNDPSASFEDKRWARFNGHLITLRFHR